MAKHNSHRIAGRAQTPALHTTRAARGLGGAAVLGTVVVGTAFAGSAAEAAPAPAAAPAAPAAAAQAAPAAPAATAPSVKLDTSSKLRWGSRGNAVEALQSTLNAKGANLAEDGVFGPRTHSAVKNFQSSQGLQVDGVVGPKTFGALGGSATSGGGASAPASTSSTSSNTSSIVNAARSAVGSPYSWGGSSLGGMDCSGLVNYAYSAAGIDLPRTSSQIANGGKWISQSQAQPGDIVAYSGHVAIYAGNGQIIDASSSKGKVVERGLWGNPIGFVTYR
ncbi:C40 family peptidase [Brachybacterium alimentarium]|uniref:Hydrolase n=2 Tax=Brachybacterium TaxID=43668 RepID=A0A2A3YLP5_9MICO|nr:peptidoglycan-binding domain-containing protein [Brachybacterium alimentarium]PCC34832.1 hydrolase [Brachybacterium alimentarium]PCC40210.1 hydrolase [Brachybacterium alimentarium]RCS69006.1 hydrolase [Brachybacterium alimentarium]RCS75959.1 hydrolase [Brachybacterium alimentarium]RCS80524.1 hydrolase [Brachybacterium alimentarium]